MADSSDSAGSWPGLLDQINRTFDLIRDIFGYALPGGVFLAIGVMAKKAGLGGFSLLDVKGAIPFEVPAWAGFLGTVAACYATGSIMAGNAYMPIGVAKWIQWLPQKKFLYPLPQSAELADWLKASKNAVAYDKLRDHPTEVTADLEVIRSRHKEFLFSLDRRETLTLMSGSMCAALLIGWFVFYWAQLQTKNIFLLGGSILLVQFATGLSHLRRVRRAVRQADALLSKDDAKPAENLNKAVLDLVNAAASALKKS